MMAPVKIMVTGIWMQESRIDHLFESQNCWGKRQNYILDYMLGRSSTRIFD